jgi:hypothetical protein
MSVHITCLFPFKDNQITKKKLRFYVDKIEKPKRIHVLLLWPHLYYIDFVNDDSTTSSTPEQEKRQTSLRDNFYEKIRVILMLNVFYVKIV